jgi:hypothetical protein
MNTCRILRHLCDTDEDHHYNVKDDDCWSWTLLVIDTGERIEGYNGSEAAAKFCVEVAEQKQENEPS